MVRRICTLPLLHPLENVLNLEPVDPVSVNVTNGMVLASISLEAVGFCIFNDVDIPDIGVVTAS